MKFLDFDVSQLEDLSSAELLKYFPCNIEIDERVFGSLNGRLIPECRLDWVENLSAPGKPLYEHYDEMWNAYRRLCLRLGDVEEDEDAEIMIDSLLRYAETVGLEMFKYGRQYEKMQAEEKQEDEKTSTL